MKVHGLLLNCHTWAGTSGAMTAALQWMNIIGVGAPTALRSAATMASGCELRLRSTAVIGHELPGHYRRHRREDVRDVMVAAVEYRFGQVNRLPVTIKWLSDNGSCHFAGDTRSFARDIGLEPRTTLSKIHEQRNG